MEGGARREREASEGSPGPLSSIRTPLRTPATPTFKIEPLGNDVPSSLDNSPLLPTAAELSSVPLFDTTTSAAADTFLPSALPTSTADQLQIHELFNTYTDERGGWELVDDKIVGVRRTKRSSSLLAEASGGKGPGRWELWSVELVMGAVIGQSELENLLRIAGIVGSASPLADSSPNDTASSLRRRHQVSTTSSSPRFLEPPSTSSPSIRFQPPLGDLPFSRARPLVAALDSSAIAVGLGNQLVLFALRQTVGRAGGLLALPKRRGVREGKKGR